MKSDDKKKMKEDDMWGSIYRVEMHKRYDGYTLYVAMVLDTRE